jgi:RNA polymerase sigma-70 factor (ECF subfamily)
VVEDADAALMLKVAAGDKTAFAALYDRYQASVARFAYKFVGDRARAEELAQDIFIKLYRSANGYQQSAKFKTFLFRVATNHCLNEIRRGEYQVTQVAENDAADGRGDLPGDDAVQPEAALAAKQLERVVRKALAEMSERERVAFTLCRFEGMPYREIAEALSCSEAAVKSLIHRATVAMAKRVGAAQEAVPAGSHA